MSIMIAEVYEAFLQSGASEARAKVAAEALAGYEARFSRLEAGQLFLRWMVNFNLAFTMAVYWKVFS